MRVRECVVCLVFVPSTLGKKKEKGDEACVPATSPSSLPPQLSNLHKKTRTIQAPLSLKSTLLSHELTSSRLGRLAAVLSTEQSEDDVGFVVWAVRCSADDDTSHRDARVSSEQAASAFLSQSNTANRKGAME